MLDCGHDCAPIRPGLCGDRALIVDFLPAVNFDPVILIPPRRSAMISPQSGHDRVGIGPQSSISLLL